MSWWEIFKEVASKGLRTVNDEINATAPQPLRSQAGEAQPENPWTHTRAGFEKYHPAYYAQDAQPTAKVA